MDRSDIIRNVLRETYGQVTTEDFIDDITASLGENWDDLIYEAEENVHSLEAEIGSYLWAALPGPPVTAASAASRITDALKKSQTA